MVFDAENVCGGLFFAPSFISARAPSRYEFVELDGDICSNCQGGVQAKTGFSGQYQLVPRTI